MPIIPQLQQDNAQFTAWRRELHAHPQTAFEETFAADFIAQRLTEFGIPIVRGLAKTGVVGTLTGRLPGRGEVKAIGLRADIDALDVTEENDVPHRSLNPGKMHACGHDGHTTMLLAAAKHLAATRDFAGTVHFIFQPAEENEGGGRVMVEEGLFEQFDCHSVYGMHNWPGLPVGEIAICPGPSMAAFDVFEIKVRGKGCHAAMPHSGVDPIVMTSHIVTALQSIASRQVNPLEQVVVSVTQFHAGDTWNVIPQEAVLRGTVRTFRSHVQDLAEASIKRIASSIAESFGGSATVDYQRRYPATINTARETQWSVQVAQSVVGDDNVDSNPAPCMGGEDFSFMLRERPGCYVWIGNGSNADGRVLHNPRYDFNDEIIPIGASYWVQLVQRLLPVATA